MFFQILLSVNIKGIDNHLSRCNRNKSLGTLEAFSWIRDPPSVILLCLWHALLSPWLPCPCVKWNRRATLLLRPFLVPGLCIYMKSVYTHLHHTAKNHKTGNDRNKFFFELFEWFHIHFFIRKTAILHSLKQGNSGWDCSFQPGRKVDYPFGFSSTSSAQQSFSRKSHTLLCGLWQTEALKTTFLFISS